MPVQASTESCVIEGLSPEIVYHAAISSKNAVGWSAVSSASRGRRILGKRLRRTKEESVEERKYDNIFASKTPFLDGSFVEGRGSVEERGFS